MAFPLYPQYPIFPQQPLPQNQSRAVEVFQVESEQAVPVFPVNNGSTIMMIDRNDSFIAVKAAALDGSSTVTFYDKRPPAPIEPPFNPAEYVRRDEIQGLVDAAVAAQRGKKKEAAE